MSGDPAAWFHAHLDVCAQCERHPFDLCPVGARLLVDAASRVRPPSHLAAETSPGDDRPAPEHAKSDPSEASPSERPAR